MFLFLYAFCAGALGAPAEQALVLEHMDVEATVNKRTPTDLTVTVHIEEGLPIESLWSDTHDFVVEEDEWGATISLLDSARRDRDVHLAWTMAGENPRGAAFASEDGFVAVTLEPRVLEDVLSQQKWELLFVLDASGSMRGQPWETATSAVRLALYSMGSDDTFNLVRFSDESTGLFNAPVPANETNIAAAEQWLELYDGGGTQMEKGLIHSLKMPGDPEALRLILLLTDGYLGKEGDIFEIVRENIGNSRLRDWSKANPTVCGFHLICSKPPATAREPLFQSGAAFCRVFPRPTRAHARGVLGSVVRRRSPLDKHL